MKTEYIYIFLLLVLFLFFPICAVGIAFLRLFVLLKHNNIWYFALVMSLYVSFINASKLIDSDPDLPWYTSQYLMAGKMHFSEYILWFGKNGKGRELFFPVFNYIIYFIAGDNVNLYRFLHSFVCYTLSFIAIIRFCQFMKIDAWKISIPIIWFACFPWVFTYSQTILRQFLAGSFLLCIIVEHFFYGKRMWIMFLCMFLSHTSTLLFFPFIYISFFHKPLTFKSSVLYLSGAIALIYLQSIAQIMQHFVGGDNALSYVLSRAATDTTFELPPLDYLKICFILILMLTSLLTYYHKRTRSIVLGENAGIHLPLVNLCAVFSLFIIGNLNQLELSNRLFSYVSMLSVFPCVYLMQKYRVSKDFSILFFVLMNILLVLYFKNSMFEYQIPYGILLMPLQYIM